MGKIDITVNGNKKQINPDMTINDILKEMRYHPDTVAITLNDNIVDKSEYNMKIIQAKDSIEILRYISGG